MFGQQFIYSSAKATLAKPKIVSLSQLTRREAIQLSLLAGGSLLLPNAPAMTAPAQAPGDFDFIAANDFHYHDDACAPWFTAVFAAMRESAPNAAFVLLGGDLADEGQPAQLADFQRLLPQLGLPTYAVPGNHDCTPATTPDGPVDWTPYRTLFPGQTNSAFTHAGWQFIGLDTADGDHWHDTTIAPGTIDYLEHTLATVEKSTPLVLFTHFPLGDHIVLPPQQPGAPTYSFRPINADELLAKLEGYNLRAILCGHFHAFTERKWAEATLTTDRCCSRVKKNHDGTNEKGWFVCEAHNGQLTRRFVEIPRELV